MKKKEIIYEIKNLNKVVSDGESNKTILSNITCNIFSGDFIGITGESGSGKSTLLHILGCIDNLSSGEITFSKQKIHEIKKNKLYQLRREIGFIFQSFYLLEHCTVYENIAYPLKIKGSSLYSDELRNEVIKVLKLVNLNDSKLGQLPKTLSGGEKQRVAIARALVSEPKVLIADEPTGNLDSTNEEIILNIFKKINEKEGKTILLVTHNKNNLKFCNRTIEIKDGKITNQTDVGEADDQMDY